MNEQQQLEQAIAIQEGLRGTVSEAIIDMTIATLREKLATLAPPPPTSHDHRRGHRPRVTQHGRCLRRRQCGWQRR